MLWCCRCWGCRQLQWAKDPAPEATTGGCGVSSSARTRTPAPDGGPQLRPAGKATAPPGTIVGGGGCCSCSRRKASGIRVASGTAEATGARRGGKTTTRRTIRQNHFYRRNLCQNSWQGRCVLSPLPRHHGSISTRLCEARGSPLPGSACARHETSLLAPLPPPLCRTATLSSAAGAPAGWRVAAQVHSVSESRSLEYGVAWVMCCWWPQLEHAYVGIRRYGVLRPRSGIRSTARRSVRSGGRRSPC